MTPFILAHQFKVTAVPLSLYVTTFIKTTMHIPTKLDHLFPK